MIAAHEMTADRQAIAAHRASRALATLLVWGASALFSAPDWWAPVRVASAAAQEAPDSSPREPTVGLPCEGCEAVFDGLPSSPRSIARLAPADEPGEPLQIEGTVYDTEGRPASGVIVYAYHTDAHGVYPEDDRFGGWARRHGRLRGWARTDGQGRYRFDTIRPASYPDGSTPAHVHMHVIEVGRCAYYVDSIHFEDDPRMSDEERADPDRARGGSGLLRPSRDADGVWVARRDIFLGRNIPGYSSCDE